MAANPDTATEAKPSEPVAVGERFRVLVAGGGVAALEAVLALRDLAGERVAMELICPAPDFTLRALSVAQPFSGEESRAVRLADFCAEHGVDFRQDALAEVWGSQRRVLTAAGADLPYDALLLATGARQESALPGARPFRGALDAAWYEELLADLKDGSVRSVVFAVPRGVRWSLPLLELALLTAHWLRGANGSEVALTYVTHERAPLEVCGEEISGHATDLLQRSGVEVLANHTATRVEDGRVLCEEGRGIDAHEVVTLPALRVPQIPGVASGRHGFIACDPEMRVDGTPGVWVAGDASWFPIKQGGIAAQQAEVAASWIAAEAGADVVPEPFRPVIRAALLTGEEPEFFRREMGRGEGEGVTALSASPLWWPPIKVAGPRLAPYLARAWSGSAGDPLGSLEDLEADGGADREEEHRAAITLALDYARVDAGEGRFGDALRWLDVAERLNVTLPEEYLERRRVWRRQLDERGEEPAPGPAIDAG